MKYTVWALLGLLVLMPFCVFLHELGHSLPLLLSGEFVEIQLGSAKPVINFEIGKLTFSSTLMPLAVGYCNWVPDLPSSLELASLISGPLVSAIMTLTVLFLLIFNKIKSQAGLFFARFVFGFTLSQFIWTVLPTKYGSWFIGYEGVYSDGYKAIQILSAL